MLDVAAGRLSSAGWRWRSPTGPRSASRAIDYQDAYYYAAPKTEGRPEDRWTRSIRSCSPPTPSSAFPLKEQEVLAGVEGAPRYAVDAVFDFVSVLTTFKKELAEAGVIFCSMCEAVRDHGELVRQYLGSVVPVSDNYFACLNSAVFSDGSFVYVPPGVRCPMELSTYFRINAAESGQFERTLIIADKGAYVSYLEGCTAPMRDENQLHAAVVELVALDDAEIKYSTVQNWYPGDAEGSGGIYNFVTKRADCRGDRSKVSLDPGRDRLGDHLEVSVLPAARRRLVRRILLDRDHQPPPAGRHRHQDDPSGAVTRARGSSPRASRPARSSNTYRGLVSAHPKATSARNFTQCDSLLIGKQSRRPHHRPTSRPATARPGCEHEATTTRLSEDQLFYAMQRGPFAGGGRPAAGERLRQEVLQELPMEFAVEAQKLVAISLEGSVGERAT